MNYCAIALMLIVVPGIFFAGCTQPSGTGPVTPTVPAITLTTPGSAMPAAATDVPRQVVTIIHQVSQVREVKDSELLFALQVPVEWSVSTHQLMKSDTSDYRTDLVADNVFSITSYYFSQDQDRAYRDQFRQWCPAPTETPVTIHDITFDRFESTSDGMTRVAYVARQTSVNERGYASVLVFIARDSNRFEKEDFEKVVSSFRYFGRESASIEPGEEIPLYDSSGNAVSRKTSGGGSLAGGSDGSTPDGWDSSDGSSSGAGSSGGSSSGGSSSGGHCPF